MLKLAVGIVVAAPFLVQCSPAIDFGHVGPCPYTRMTNDVDDEANLAAGRACFDETVVEGTPITWDLEVFTVEGDPIYHRVEWDGEIYSIHYDGRADTYGGGTKTDKCASLAPGNFPSCP